MDRAIKNCDRLTSRCSYCKRIQDNDANCVLVLMMFGEQLMVKDELKYLQGSHATVSLLHLQVAVLEYHAFNP